MQDTSYVLFAMLTKTETFYGIIFQSNNIEFVSRDINNMKMYDIGMAFSFEIIIVAKRNDQIKDRTPVSINLFENRNLGTYQGTRFVWYIEWNNILEKISVSAILCFHFGYQFGW